VGWGGVVIQEKEITNMDIKQNKATCKYTGNKSRKTIINNSGFTEIINSEELELYQFMVGGLQAK
jgi:hypothetical protein